MAQSPEIAVDLKRIPQRAVRDLVLREKVKTASDFQQISPACYLPADSGLYQCNLKTWVVKAPVGKVWEKYLSLTPRKAWSGRAVRFGFLFSKSANKFIYNEEADNPITVGSIIYVNLKLLKGLKNMGVAFEITRLDEESRTICFCYLEDGASHGSQEIQLTEMADGNTRISHLTHYRSRSSFRDKNLYPFFHELFVGEFHENVIREIETGL
jgi:hypothetical protein